MLIKDSSSIIDNQKADKIIIHPSKIMEALNNNKEGIILRNKKNKRKINQMRDRLIIRLIINKKAKITIAKMNRAQVLKWEEAELQLEAIIEEEVVVEAEVEEEVLLITDSIYKIIFLKLLIDSFN